MNDQYFALMQAARTGDLNALKQCISACSKKQCTDALHGNSTAVGFLLPLSDPDGLVWECPLAGATEKGHEECFEILLPASNQESKNKALQAAAISGHSCFLSRLMDLCTQESIDEAFLNAAVSGHVACLQQLIEKTSPYAFGTGLSLAAAYGKDNSVRILIEITNPQECHHALVVAAQCGHTECVQLLIGACDPKINDSEALEQAVTRSHQKCIDALIPVSDAQAVLNRLQVAFSPQFLHYLETKMCAHQRNLLNKEVGTQLLVTTRKL